MTRPFGRIKPKVTFRASGYCAHMGVRADARINPLILIGIYGDANFRTLTLKDFAL